MSNAPRLGRVARMATRAAALPLNLRPVWPGMEGGRYRPLDDVDVRCIHHAADNDIIGAIQRTIRGLDVSEEALSLDAIRETCIGGPNHFLGSEQTLARMQTEYLYPIVGDRTSPKEWEEKGRPSILDKATRKLETILGSHYPTHVPKHIDEQIRAAFPVHLPRNMMESA